jgi:hypothetical protein
MDCEFRLSGQISLSSEPGFLHVEYGEFSTHSMCGGNEPLVTTQKSGVMITGFHFTTILKKEVLSSIFSPVINSLYLFTFFFFF